MNVKTLRDHLDTMLTNGSGITEDSIIGFGLTQEGTSNMKPLILIAVGTAEVNTTGELRLIFQLEAP